MSEEIILFESFKELQIVGMIISGFLLARTIWSYKQGRIGKGGFILWCFVWGTALVTFLIPGIPEAAITLLSAENSVLIAVVFANVFLFILLFILYEQVYKTNKRFNLLIQNLTIVEKFLKDSNLSGLTDNKGEEKVTKE